MLVTCMDSSTGSTVHCMLIVLFRQLYKKWTATNFSHSSEAFRKYPGYLGLKHTGFPFWKILLKIQSAIKLKSTHCLVVCSKSRISPPWHSRICVKLSYTVPRTYTTVNIWTAGATASYAMYLRQPTCQRVSQLLHTHFWHSLCHQGESKQLNKTADSHSKFDNRYS